MTRLLNRLQISGKLLLMPLVILPFVISIAVTAYVGLSQQRDIVDTLYHKRLAGSGNSARVLSGLSSAHAGVSGIMRSHHAAQDGAEAAGQLRQQAGAIASEARSMQDAISSAGLRGEEQKAFQAAMDAVNEYRKTMDQASDVIVSADKESVARFMTTADEKFLEAARRLQALQETDISLGDAGLKDSRRVFFVSLVVIAAILFTGSLVSAGVYFIVVRREVVRPIRSFESAAGRVAQGFTSFEFDSGSPDELSRAGTLLKESFLSLEGVLQRIKELSDRILKVVEEVEQEAEKVLKGAEAEAEATGNISTAVEELNATATEIADNTEDLASSATDASSSIEQMVSSIRHINDSIQELNGIVESTTSSIDSLSKTIQSVAENSGELSIAAEETLTAVSEIAAAIKEVDASAKESAALSEKATSEAATLGMASISKTMSGMKEIASSVQNTAQCISVLGNRSREIEKILSVIRSVNDETNLLSLNAAILASKAGEHGRGFAVVAAEMKDLAERTGSSAGEIASLIQGVRQEVKNAEDAMNKGVTSVEEGLRLAREAEESLREVLNSSKRSSEMASVIKRSTEAQAVAANLVMRATERIRQMTDHIAKATAEQASSIALVTGAAEKMEQLSHRVSKATSEQAASSVLIARTTELVSERSRRISQSLAEHKKGSFSILSSVDLVKNIPVENKKRAFAISTTLWNLQKDAELLGVEMERFRFSTVRGQSLRLGVVPLQEPSVMYRKFTPLSEYLADRLGRKVDLKVAIDMESAIKDIGENITQLCAMGPANYIEANTKHRIKVIAKALRLGKPFHRAATVVRADGGIQSVKDLKGKTFAFVSPKSATGHIMPLAVLKEAGMTTDDLASHRFLGDHEKVARAVLDGEFDAGGMMEETAEKYSGMGLRILQLSSEIPEFNICCNPSVDQATINAIRDALTALDVSKKDEAMILRSLGKDCTGFVPATEEDYARFKSAIQGLEVQGAIDSHFRRRRGPGKTG